MSEHPLFNTVDPVALDRVTNDLGNAFADAARSRLERIAEDDTIPPDAMLAGIVKAHLAGAVAGMYQASRSKEGREEIVMDAADWLAKRLEELEAQSEAIAAVERAAAAAAGHPARTVANDL